MLAVQSPRDRAWNSADAGLSSASFCRIASAAGTRLPPRWLPSPSEQDAEGVWLPQARLEFGDRRVGVDQLLLDRQRLAVSASASACLPRSAVHGTDVAVAIRQAALEFA